MSKKKNKIKLTGAEVQSGHNRQDWAETLITQLPVDHDGRNSWLLNYGKGVQSESIRFKRGVEWNEKTESAHTFK